MQQGRISYTPVHSSDSYQRQQASWLLLNLSFGFIWSHRSNNKSSKFLAVTALNKLESVNAQKFTKGFLFTSRLKLVMLFWAEIPSWCYQNGPGAGTNNAKTLSRRLAEKSAGPNLLKSSLRLLAMLQVFMIVTFWYTWWICCLEDLQSRPQIHLKGQVTNVNIFLERPESSHLCQLYSNVSSWLHFSYS